MTDMVAVPVDWAGIVAARVVPVISLPGQAPHATWGRRRSWFGRGGGERCTGGPTEGHWGGALTHGRYGLWEQLLVPPSSPPFRPLPLPSSP